MHGRDDYFKRIQTSEMIFAGDMANIMIDTSDAFSRIQNQWITSGHVRAEDVGVFLENFYGFYLRSRTYIKDEKALAHTAELFKSNLRLSPNFSQKTITSILETFNEYLDAIHASPLMQLIENATRIIDQ